MALDITTLAFRTSSTQKATVKYSGKGFLLAGLLVWSLFPLPVVIIGDSKTPWLYFTAWSMGALNILAIRQWLLNLYDGKENVMKKPFKLVAFLILSILPLFLLAVVLWRLEFEFSGFTVAILGGLWITFIEESQRMGRIIHEIWKTIKHVWARKVFEEEKKFIERFMQAWYGDENRKEWKLFVIARTIVLMLFILWALAIVLFSVSYSGAVSGTLFVLGTVAFSVGILLMKYTTEDRFGLTSFVLALCIAGWIVLVRDNTLDTEFGYNENNIALWFFPGENYFAVLALSATAFTLLLAFRITRISTYTAEEERLVYKLLSRFDQIDRDAKNNLLKKLARTRINLIEKFDSNKFIPNIEAKEIDMMRENVHELRLSLSDLESRLSILEHDLRHLSWSSRFSKIRGETMGYERVKEGFMAIEKCLSSESIPTTLKDNQLAKLNNLVYEYNLRSKEELRDFFEALMSEEINELNEVVCRLGHCLSNLELGLENLSWSLFSFALGDETSGLDSFMAGFKAVDQSIEGQIFNSMFDENLISILNEVLEENRYHYNCIKYAYLESENSVISYMLWLKIEIMDRLKGLKMKIINFEKIGNFEEIGVALYLYLGWLENLKNNALDDFAYQCNFELCNNTGIFMYKASEYRSKIENEQRNYIEKCIELVFSSVSLRDEFDQLMTILRNPYKNYVNKPSLLISKNITNNFTSLASLFSDVDKLLRVNFSIIDAADIENKENSNEILEQIIEKIREIMSDTPDKIRRQEEYIKALEELRDLNYAFYRSLYQLEVEYNSLMNMRGKSKKYIPRSFDALQTFFENFSSQSDMESFNQLGKLQIELEQDGHILFDELELVGYKQIEVQIDEIIPNEINLHGSKNIILQIYAILKRAIKHVRQLQDFYYRKFKFKAELKQVHESIRILTALKQIDHSETMEDMECAYNLARGELEKRLNDTVSGSEREKYLLEAQSDLDALAHSKQYGREYGEPTALVFLGSLTLLITLLTRPEGEGLTGMIFDGFSFIFSATVTFLTFHVFDLHKDRNVSILEEDLGTGRYRVEFKKRSYIAEKLRSIYCAVAVLVSVCSLIWLKWA